MAVVCGNNQATRSFARTGAHSSRRLGTQREPPPTSSVINLDNQTQGFDDFDDFAPTHPPTNNTPTSSTSKAKEGKNDENALRWRKKSCKILNIN